MSLDEAAVREVVHAFVQKKDRLPAAFDADTFDYLDQGYVDSIGVIQFMGLLEERFGIVFEDADLESPEFRTLGGLVRMVLTKQRARSKP
jgi:acyl carrier protein